MRYAQGGYIYAQENGKLVITTAADPAVVIFDSSRFPPNSFNSGTATQSGDGIKTEFSIPHGLATTPSFVHAMAKSDDADNTAIRKVTSTATHVLISYKVAPPAGDNNLAWSWMARV